MIVFPSSIVGGFDVESSEENTVNVSRSGVRYVRNMESQRWGANVTFVRMQNEQAKELYADLVSLRGSKGNARVHAPFMEQHPNISGSVVANGAYAAGTTSLSLSGGYVGTLSKGSLINFSGHDKAYMVMSHVDALLTISPPLRKAVTNEVINYESPYILAYLDSDTPNWATARKVSQIQANFVEELM